MIYRDKEDFLDEYDNLINISNIGYIIQDFQNSLSRLNKLKDLYNPKLNENDINVNHAKEITDLATSYTYSIPISFNGGNIDNLVEYFKSIDQDSYNYGLGKEQSIYGKAYELISFDSDNYLGVEMPYLTKLSVFNTFIVQDNTNKHKTFLGVYYSTDTDKQGNIIKYIVTIYTTTKIYTATGTDLQSLTVQTEEEHLLGEVPIFQLCNNEEEKGDFEDVIGLIKAYNVLQENRCKDKQQFVDKLLVITNSSLGDTEDEVRQSLEYLKKYNVLELNNDETNTVDAKYINVAMDEEQVEVLKKALSNDIHKIAKVPDLTDSNFASNSNVSGIAMAYKLFGTEQLAGEKERQFKKLLRWRFRIINNVLSLKGQGLDLYSISIKMKRNVPDNLDDKLKELQGTEGILSIKTRLKRYDSEIDYDEEMKQLIKEKQQMAQMMASAYDNYDYKQSNNNDNNKQDDKAEQIEQQNNNNNDR